MPRLKGFTFYITYWDVAQDIEDDVEQALFYRAVVDYMFGGVDRESELPWQAKVCFKAVKPNLKTSKNRSANGRQKGSKSTAKVQQTDNKSASKVQQVKDKVKGKEEDVRTSSSSLLAKKGESKGKPSPFSQNPFCPECGGMVWRNTQSGLWDCERCFTSFKPSGVRA